MILGSLGDRIGDVLDNVCDENETDIKEFYNRVVDLPMCSDMCPCELNAFSIGGYSSLDTSVLTEFNRASYSIDGALTDNMFFTRNDFDSWLAAKGASDGYSSLTKRILQ